MGVIHKRVGEPGEFRWEGVPLERYEHPSASAVTKQVMIGPQDGAPHFAMRYFEIAPGGTSALDTHGHDHGVFIVCGRGIVRLGASRHEIVAGDVIYIESEEVHQFENVGAEPLGFVCVVPPRP